MQTKKAVCAAFDIFDGRVIRDGAVFEREDIILAFEGL